MLPSSIEEKIQQEAYEEATSEIEQMLATLASEAETTVTKATRTECYLNLVICYNYSHETKDTPDIYELRIKKAEQAAEKALQASEGLTPHSSLAKLIFKSAYSFNTFFEIQANDPTNDVTVKLYERGLQLLPPNEEAENIGYNLAFAHFCLKALRKEKGLYILEGVFKVAQNTPGIIAEMRINEYFDEICTCLETEGYELAEHFYKRAYAVAMSQGDVSTAVILQLKLSICCLNHQRLGEAEEMARQACELAQGLMIANNLPMEAFSNAAKKFADKNSYEIAARLYKQELVLRQPGVDDEEAGHLYLDLSACYLQLGKSVEAKKAVEQACKLKKYFYYYTSILDDLASKFYEQNQYVVAGELCQRSIDALKQRLQAVGAESPSHALIWKAYLLLGNCYHQRALLEEADSCYREAIKMIVAFPNKTPISKHLLANFYNALARYNKIIPGIQNLYSIAASLFEGKSHISMQAFKSIYDTLLKVPYSSLPEYRASIKDLQHLMELIRSFFLAGTLPEGEIKEFLQVEDNFQQFVEWEARLQDFAISLERLVEEHPSFGMAVGERMDKLAAALNEQETYQAREQEGLRQQITELRAGMAEFRTEVAALKEENCRLREENQGLKRELPMTEETVSVHDSKKRRIGTAFFSPTNLEASGTSADNAPPLDSSQLMPQ